MENIIKQNAICTVNSLIELAKRAGVMLPTTFKNISDYLDHMENSFPNDTDLQNLRCQLNNI